MTGEVSNMWLAAILGPVCLTGGAYWWYRSTRARRRGVRTTAEIIESRVVYIEDGFCPYIRYRYTVDGQQYTSDQIFATAGRVSGTGFWADRFAARFPEGRRVPAWYAPDDPARVFLVNRWERLILVPIALGLFLSGLAIEQLLAG